MMQEAFLGQLTGPSVRSTASAAHRFARVECLLHAGNTGLNPVQNGRQCLGR
jgi:hypothetical protein